MLPNTHKTSSRLSNIFMIEQPNPKTKIWYHWFNIRIREYRFMEIFFFISLIMVFYRLQTISNQNDRVLEMASSMERKLEELAAQKSDQDISKFEKTQPLEQSDGVQRTKLPTRDSTDKMKPPVSTQSDLVLLDRPQPPADKAWCTDDKNPVLTIDPAKLVKPISVSYQHSEWNESIPSEAPKTYDVVACLDYHCKLWVPLALNCQYNQSNGTEQMCNTSSHLEVPTIGKVQFRFRENYGDPDRTCVSLVRVYGETKKPVKMEKHLDSEKTCADLKWYYHNSYIGYAWARKNCTVLYENECCSECPECYYIQSKRSDFRDGQFNGKKTRRKTQPLEQSDGVQRTKLPTRDSTDKMKPPVSKMSQSTTQTNNSILKTSISKGTFRFNAANYLLGASVETGRSSSSNLNKKFKFDHDQCDLVLLDRPQPPADKAWCTDDKNPVLTIDLAKLVKPISVSYQHSEWNESIPDDAPRTYDVVACLDYHCKLWEPLALNCQYNQHKSSGTEQMCNTSSHLEVPTIGKVQFRFRENYGDPDRTCVSLVRVYGETKKPVKMEKHLNSEKTCADLKWNYHNSYIGYAWAHKNCTVLYENECCSECPECYSIQFRQTVH
ncbi:unnamed protein product [Caenorhabditis nigoni]